MNEKLLSREDITSVSEILHKRVHIPEDIFIFIDFPISVIVTYTMSH